MNNYNWFQRWFLSKYDWYKEENKAFYKHYNKLGSIFLILTGICVLALQFIDPSTQKTIGLTVVVFAAIFVSMMVWLLSKSGNIQKEDKIERRVTERLVNK